jgi:hypothetical protein
MPEKCKGGATSPARQRRVMKKDLLIGNHGIETEIVFRYNRSALMVFPPP